MILLGRWVERVRVVRVVGIRLSLIGVVRVHRRRWRVCLASIAILIVPSLPLIGLKVVFNAKFSEKKAKRVPLDISTLLVGVLRPLRVLLLPFEPVVVEAVRCSA